MSLSFDSKITVKGTHHKYTYDAYKENYAQSLKDPDIFWQQQASRLDWITFPKTIKNTSFNKENFKIKWYEDGVLNACYNCVDRHAEKTPNAPAITWEDDEPNNSKVVTYAELLVAVSKFANVLKSMGVGKGDVVTLYMPMVVESVYAMLACARIGAVHNVVFGGFSPESLAKRIDNCNSQYVITANVCVRGGRTLALKENVDIAVQLCSNVKHTLVVNINDMPASFNAEIDVNYNDVVQTVSDRCDIEPMHAEDPLFILYTSGSTGTPKGLVHTTGGYLVYAGLTFETSFDYRNGEVYWCTADVGWITGHTYLVYGPLSMGANTVVFAGVPTYPDASRVWQVIDTHKVNIFYTAPTAIRALLTVGDSYLESSKRDSLRILGTVGEPINVEAWEWYYKNVGHERCPIIDTWWQTETGGHMVTPIPYLWDLKPSKASFPMFGASPVLLNAQSEIIDTSHESGAFCMADSWPGQARTIFNDHDRFIETYFSDFEGYYYTGDGAMRDEDGYIRITGRMDDVLNVSGHRLGTAEIEDAFNMHEHVAETAIVGYDHPIKGEGIYAYCILKNGYEPSAELERELVQFIRTKIGPIASPDFIQFTTGLPKTRSGKIMRRILRKIAQNDFGSLGDISTLAEPQVVESLIENRKNKNCV